jgi:uncharacterized RDD family membrane protein YckC
MTSMIHFETPENVQISYSPAGLGTRFTAWLLDGVFVVLLMVALGILSIALAAAAGVAMENFRQETRRSEAPEFAFYMMAAIILIWGFASFLYFTVCELFGRGQTLGKRYCGLRVAKIDGFSLDTTCILLRNVFRVIDQLPALWIVPVVSSRSQRFGDMVAGTIVVTETHGQLSTLRTHLLASQATERRFRFDGAMLSRARPVDIEAAEAILDRWPQLSPVQQTDLLARVVDPIAHQLNSPTPDVADRLTFLEDFLTSIYRRDARRLG